MHVRKPCSVLMLRARKVCALCLGKHVHPNVHVCAFVASSTTPTLVPVCVCVTEEMPVIFIVEGCAWTHLFKSR